MRRIIDKSYQVNGNNKKDMKHEKHKAFSLNLKTSLFFFLSMFLIPVNHHMIQLLFLPTQKQQYISKIFLW